MELTEEQKLLRKQKRREYYLANRDKELSKAKEYVQANRESVLEQKRKWREENREKHNEAQRRWYAANKDKVAEQKRIYNANLTPEQRKKMSEKVGARQKAKRAEISAYHKEWRKTPEGKAKFMEAQKRYRENRKKAESKLAELGL